MLIHLTTDLLDGALDCFENDDVRAARGVETLEETMDYMTEEIRSLEKKLMTAVASEDYEMAARYRDQIRALREGTKTDA